MEWLKKAWEKSNADQNEQKKVQNLPPKIEWIIRFYFRNHQNDTVEHYRKCVFFFGVNIATLVRSNGVELKSFFPLTAVIVHAVYIIFTCVRIDRNEAR